jgi:hypothetical protein
MMKYSSLESAHQDDSNGGKFIPLGVMDVDLVAKIFCSTINSK